MTLATTDTLAQLALFQGLRPEVLVALCEASRVFPVSKYEPVVWVGDCASELFVILRGSVKRAMVSASGQERVMAIMGPGESFGDAECIGAQRYAAAVTALEPTTIVAINFLTMKQQIEREPALALRLLELLAERQFALDSDIACSFFQSGGERVLDYLLRLAHPLPSATRASSGTICFTLPANKQTIASRIGMTPETLSRSLRELHEAGLLTVERRTVHLHMSAIAAHTRRQQMGSVAAAHFGDTPARAVLPASSTVDLHAVNASGLQRMLSQRMARAWLMRGAGILPEQACACLEQSISLFDRQLDDLAKVSSASEVRLAHGELQRAWMPYKRLLLTPPARKSTRAVLASSEQVLHNAHRLTLSMQTASASPFAKRINLAGRQRMLSQKLAKLFVSQYWGGTWSGSRREMELTREEFVSALRQLDSEREPPALPAHELGQVREYWRLLEPELDRRTQNDYPQSAQRVVELSDRIVDAINTALSSYSLRAP